MNYTIDDYVLYNNEVAGRVEKISESEVVVGGIWYHKEMLTKWTPEENEVCWFKNSLNRPCLSRYKQTRTVLGQSVYVDEYGDEFVEIAPYMFPKLPLIFEN